MGLMKRNFPITRENEHINQEKVSQNLKYHRPVYVNSIVVIRAERRKPSQSDWNTKETKRISKKWEENESFSAWKSLVLTRKIRTQKKTEQIKLKQYLTRKYRHQLET